SRPIHWLTDASGRMGILLGEVVRSKTCWIVIRRPLGSKRPMPATRDGPGQGPNRWRVPRRVAEDPDWGAVPGPLCTVPELRGRFPFPFRRTAVLIAYLTTDEVNLDLADRLATECGATLYPLSFQDGPPSGAFDAVLYDWDYLSPPWRQQ